MRAHPFLLLPLAWAHVAGQAVASNHTQEARDWANRQLQEQRQQQQQQFDREKKSYGTQGVPFVPGSTATSPSGSNGNALRERVEQLRAHALKLPALPPDRNPLLGGSWKRAASASAGALGGGGLGQLMAMASAGPCGMLLGSGVIEFAANEYFSTDASGRDSLGRVQYRMEGQKLYVIPQAGVRLLLFEALGRDRIREALVGGDCVLVRVGAQAAAVLPGAATGAKAAVAGKAGAVVDGAAFRCGEGLIYHVTGCRGDVCDLTEWHLPALTRYPSMAATPVAQIAARVKACEAGGLRYTAENKPVFVQ